MQSLTITQVVRRVAALSFVAAGLAALRWVDPVAAGTYLPFRTSCGQWTGLPCVLCGMTRAVHHLLNGNLQRALYFNWLAFPGLFLLAALSLLLVMETLTRRPWLPRLENIRLTPGQLGALFALLLSLWVFQSWLAVSQHKSELLNPQGFLYAAFVR